jgi:hypothetical protein
MNNIKNNGQKEDIPKVALKVVTDQYFDQPILTIYKRKNENYALPYMYAELRITTLIFVYILPFSSKDKISFSDKKDFDEFWAFNKHYSQHEDWVFNDFSIDKSIHTIMDLKMSEREK